MAAPAVATTTTTIDSDADQTITINVPASTAAGDVLYFVVSSDNGSATYDTPSGLTLEGSIVVGGPACLYLFSRRADGTEGASYTFTCSGLRFKNGAGLRVTGVDAGVTDLTHQFATLNDTGTGTAHSSPAVTTTLADCLILSAFCPDNTGVDSVAAAGSETEVIDIQNPGFNGMVLAVYRTAAASAGTYDHDVTFSPSGAACVSMTWAINAGAVAAGGGAHNMMLLGVG